MTDSYKKIELSIACIAALVTLLLIFIIHYQKQQVVSLQPTTPRFVTLPTAELPPDSERHTQQPTEQSHWHTVIIRHNDTLERIFTTLNIAMQDLWQLTKLQDSNFKTLQPGEEFKFLLDKNHRLQIMQLYTASNKIIEFYKVNKQFKRRFFTLPLTTKLTFKFGTVNHSLLGSMIASGLSHKLAQQFITIFQSKINFRRDIHPGDRFSVLYNDYYINGKKHHTGQIAAAELLTRKQKYQAVNYSTAKNHATYYTPSGENLAHRFLTYPVKFKRISSTFSRNRLDPYLHRLHPHLGVDFAAHSGTPIHSIGNGKIVFIGHDHGYGNAIKIRYDRHYSALYAHMQRFATHLKLHQYVHRGDVIGYVGSTGWSTGPHLHFGFYVNGQAQNWLKVKPPYDPPVPRKAKQDFLKSSRELLATMHLYHATSLAQNTKNPALKGIK